ncbi:MAG: folate-binding protein [Actinomycetota bacterium]|nr:folate-binding protein [Actinomycetota bacterium]
MIATDAYTLATREVALIDRSERAKLLLTGAGAPEFLQGQVTNDVEGLARGEGCYAAFLNPKGKLRADVRVLALDEGLWLDAEGYAKQVVDWVIDSFSVGLDVRREDLTASRCILSLVGPAARESLDVAPPEREHAHVAGEHGLYVATDLGVDVICEDPDAVRHALGIEEVPFEVAEVLRVESGRPRLGLDMDNATIPEEAGLNERAVSFTKGCYVGQETVARLHYRGKPNRHLRGLALTEAAERGDQILLAEGKQVGTVGSTCVSPALGPIALALIRREAGPGDEVLVGAAGTPARVVDPPFDRP